MITVHLTSMHVEARKGGGRGQLSFGIHGVDLNKTTCHSLSLRCATTSEFQMDSDHRTY